MKTLILIFFISILLRIITYKKPEKMAEVSQREKAEFIDKFYDRKIDYKCLDYQPENDSICKINPARACIIENHAACDITPDDDINAFNYAYRKLCKDKGHCVAEHPDGSITCEFTKDTCLANSRKKKNLSQEYFDGQIESINKRSKDPDKVPYTPEELKEHIKTTKKSFYYNKHYWIDNVGCVDGSVSGIAGFQNYCEKEHPCNMGEWHFDEKTFNCTIKPSYCSKMKMKLRNGMCVPKDGVAEKILGKFVSRGLPCPPYANVWGGGVRNSSNHVSDIMAEKCFNNFKEPELQID